MIATSKKLKTSATAQAKLQQTKLQQDKLQQAKLQQAKLQLEKLPHAKAPIWTFFSNHAHVLICLSMNNKLVLREIALSVGITERAVQKIIAQLAGEGFIKRKRIGRNNKYTLLLNKPLRHAIERHKTIGDVVKLLQS